MAASADLDVRAAQRANLSGCFRPRSCPARPSIGTRPGRAVFGIGQDVEWARSFPHNRVAGRMRTHAGTRACTHLPASRCCGGLYDVKRCSMFVSGMFGQQSFGKTSFSTIAGCRLFLGECFARTHALVALPPLFQTKGTNPTESISHNWDYQSVQTQNGGSIWRVPCTVLELFCLAASTGVPGTTGHSGHAPARPGAL